MRFIVKEQDYETPIGAGLFRFELDGVPTGATEQWRLSKALDGYQLLRVDLDAREASSGHSYLFHLVRQEDGTPERLGYRFWGDGLQVAGTLLFSRSSITGTRTVNGRTHEEDMDIPPGTPFWFPSVIGLGLLAKMGPMTGQTAVTLHNKVGDEDTLALKQLAVSTNMADGPTMLEIARQQITVTPYRVSWKSGWRDVQMDENGWPVFMERPAPKDGERLTAVETRNIWY